jgi:hypothetical protein
MLGLARITDIYWAIECTPKPSFAKVSRLGRITDIYWAIECTPKPSFVNL